MSQKPIKTMNPEGEHIFPLMLDLSFPLNVYHSRNIFSQNLFCHKIRVSTLWVTGRYPSLFGIQKLIFFGLSTLKSWSHLRVLCQAKDQIDFGQIWMPLCVVKTISWASSCLHPEGRNTASESAGRTLCPLPGPWIFESQMALLMERWASGLLAHPSCCSQPLQERWAFVGTRAPGRPNLSYPSWTLLLINH